LKRIDYKAIAKAATISTDGLYRYDLTRTWGGPAYGNPKTVLFVMCNPSDADGEDDDPTVQKTIRLGVAWGFERSVLVNYAAFRTPHPRNLFTVDDPFGPMNEAYIREHVKNAGMIVAAWGCTPEKLETVKPGGLFRLNRALYGRDLYVLKLTKGGCPQHPRFIPEGTSLKFWKNVQNG
jgi:hypothetical protein